MEKNITVFKIPILLIKSVYKLQEISITTINYKQKKHGNIIRFSGKNMF